MNNELVVIGYIFSLITIAYLWLYPKLKLYNLNSLSSYDFVVSVISLLIGWSVYGGKDISFSLYVWDTSWFWFSIVVYFIIEFPFVLWYFKKYEIIKNKFNDKKEMKDTHGEKVEIGSYIKIISLDPKDFSYLEKERLSQIMNMIGEVFKVYEIDEYGQAWVEKVWESTEEDYFSDSIGLRRNEFELYNQSKEV